MAAEQRQEAERPDAPSPDLPELADVAVRAPADRTLIVQEHHLPIYHTLSLMLEDAFFG